MLLSRRDLIALAAAVGLSASLASGARADDGPLLVFAAASLKEAVGSLAEAYEKETGTEVQVSFASSGALAKQIEAGAPADVFISANTKWMDVLSEKGLTVKATEEPLLGNGLVLVAPADSPLEPVTITRDLDLAGLLGDGHLAIGETTSVPAGTYGKAALESLGLFASVEPRLAQAANVRAALALVGRGEAPLGIVYATDAAADPQVKVVGTFPEGSYPAIVYPVAVLAESKNPAAASFVAFLKSATAAASFTAAGFTVVNAPSTN
ncbi:molybdate ABC transporter substrate-binding protein [Zavarzinia compransoris]|uniref:molybdate ABC transporter substrate-binding protein n=1 Tax=Zavarzinia marina TaxID=2911065 RepID=UPI001F3F447B|nr:molybdate ABC transporter substrate-binding protein [Zavarzinia marina]MCF4165512.1 molybdate ABC transporter substrate-binding protein [Zavarzinia marina]